MLAVALPEIRSEFDVGHAAIGWLISSYLIVMAVAQPLGGRLGDQSGRALVLRISLVAFLGCSIAAIFAPTFAFLAVMRTGQAMAGAALIPTGMAMLRSSVPIHELGQINGLHGAAMGISAASGPILGSLLLTIGSWQLLFVLNIPLALLALLMVLRLRYEQSTTERAPVDVVGALLFAALLAAITAVLNGGREGLTETRGVIAVAATIAIATVFVVAQSRTAVTAVAWSLLRVRTFAAASMQVLLMNLVMYTTLLSMPFFIKEVQGAGSGRTGMLLGTMFVLMAVMAPISGRLADVYGRRLPVLVGTAAAVVGAAILLATLAEDAPPALMAGSLALIGFGTGTSFGSASIIVWPPAITPPASATFSPPPRRISATTSLSISAGKPAMLSAIVTSPPIA
ncbi:MAG TPA: MFS transporter [Dehalococcoidia bacterium]|nr:MFS transporter [Dehalococcoidia bacterium]